MRHLSRLAAVLALAVVLFGTALPTNSVVAQEADGNTQQLYYTWSLITWHGPDNVPVEDAVHGTGAVLGGDDVSDIVTAIFAWDGAEQRWVGYFPAGSGIPGANDLETLEAGRPYLVAINATGGAEWHVPEDAGEIIRIGALLSITGPGSSLGATSKAGLEIAVDEWNTRMESEGRGVRFVLDIEDTQLDPDLAVEGFNALVDRGAQAIIGPQSSSEVAAVGELADDTGVLVVSQGSTASSLSGVYNNVFRFVPTDVVAGEALIDLLLEDEVDHIVPMWRNDSGNIGHANSIHSIATAEGIDVSSGVVYEPEATDYTTSLNELAEQVSDAIDDGAENVVVFLAGFQEVADIFAAAASVDGLDEVTWYGADGSARASQLITTAGSPEFAVLVGGFASPLIDLPADAETEYADLIAQIADAAGIAPDAFGLAAYDAFNALAEAALAADNGNLRDAFLDVVVDYDGVTGIINLNAGGDRVAAPYGFFSICEDGAGGFEWQQTALWTPALTPGNPGDLTFGSCNDPL